MPVTYLMIINKLICWLLDYRHIVEDFIYVSQIKEVVHPQHNLLGKKLLFYYLEFMLFNGIFMTLYNLLAH